MFGFFISMTYLQVNFLTSRFISQWGKMKWLIFFSKILVVITISIMDDIRHAHPGLPRCKFVLWQPWGHVTSSNVTKLFLPIASHRKEVQHRACTHCVQIVKTHRMVYILTLRSRWGQVTWGQLVTLTWWGHDIHIPMRIHERISMVLLFLL